MPACSINLASRLGFRREEELASLSLKWIPCRFRERKWANFWFVAGFGEPGGDGGMSRLGMGGRVMSRIKARFEEKGEDFREGSWGPMLLLFVGEGG